MIGLIKHRMYWWYFHPKPKSKKKNLEESYKVFVPEGIYKILMSEGLRRVGDLLEMIHKVPPGTWLNITPDTEVDVGLSIKGIGKAKLTTLAFEILSQCHVKLKIEDNIIVNFEYL